jgi:hypothetical protein
MNADLEKAKKDVGVAQDDIAAVARAGRNRGRLVLILAGALTAVVSFLVAFEWPAQKEDTPSGYPYVSLAAAPLITIVARRRLILALPTLVVIAMVSFGLGALLGDGFFGFGATYSAVANDQIEARD